MQVSMMSVRIMRMAMGEPRMGMGMTMGLTGWVARIMVVLMMLIVPMLVDVRQRLMRVFMTMRLSQMKPGAQRH